MPEKPLRTIFHIDEKEYKLEYERRYNNSNALHLNVNIGEYPAFICQTPEIFKQIISIERLDKMVSKICLSLPGIAIEQFSQKCLIDEILLTNDIEGVHSTRKEIQEILQDLSKKNKRSRFAGLVAKYNSLLQDHNIQFKTCQDIRKVYDDIFYDEIKANDPDNLPYGVIFRKKGVEVQSASQKVIHKGLFPESLVIKTFEQSLDILNDESIDIFIRIAVFHYLFGYIHPFYDGNGRTSRFISSCILSDHLTPLIGFRLSYTIKENIYNYYKAFDICNDPRNRGELTPFVEMFLDIVIKSMNRLYETLVDKKNKLNHYLKYTNRLPNSYKPYMADLYDLLIRATLFSNIGLSRQELVVHMGISDNTLRTKLSLIPKHLLIENRQRNRKYYLLDLEQVDRVFDME